MGGGARSARGLYGGILRVKIAISGKGGVGKTTISALVAASLHERGCDVIAIDADPDSNLLACLGHPDPASVPPLVELKDLIEERTGVKPGTTGGMFRLNPEVSDLPDRYAVDLDGIRVLVAGAVKKGGSGCYCPENALVRALVSHVLLDENAALVLDMEAGVEHLGRGTIAAIDRLLVVVEPGRRSVETAMRVKTMAADIGLESVSVIGNRIRSPEDDALLADLLDGIELLGCVPYDEAVRQAEASGSSVLGASPKVEEAVLDIVKKLEKDQ